MLVPATRAQRSPGFDFTVLVSLTGGLLLWLVLACFGLARLQQQATLQLQRAAARVVAVELAPALARGVPVHEALAARPALRALADSSGLQVTLRSARPGGTATTDQASLLGQAIVQSLVHLPIDTDGVGPAMVVVDRAVAGSGVALAPVGPQLLLAFVVALLAITTTIGGALLVRLRREHRAAGLRSTFASAVSHELRTPLAQILLFAETLQLGRTRTEQDRARATGAIVQEARRLMRLVDNVLRFSRLESRGARLKQEPVAIGALVRDTVAQFTPLAETAQVCIEVQAAHDGGRSDANTHANTRTTVPADGDASAAAPTVDVATGDDVALADADAVRQVLLNLLDNAVKHGPRAQRVVARVESAPGIVRLIVDDEGPGVPGADRHRIWQPFERGTRDDVTGTGLGLMIVRSLTQAMGGTVRCESRASSTASPPSSTTAAMHESRAAAGARFVVELPAMRPSRREDAA